MTLPPSTTGFCSDLEHDGDIIQHLVISFEKTGFLVAVRLMLGGGSRDRLPNGRPCQVLPPRMT